MILFDKIWQSLHRNFRSPVVGDIFQFKFGTKYGTDAACDRTFGSTHSCGIIQLFEYVSRGQYEFKIKRIFVILKAYLDDTQEVMWAGFIFFRIGRRYGVCQRVQKKPGD